MEERTTSGGSGKRKRLAAGTRCDQCGTNFSLETELVSHIVSVHRWQAREEGVPCSPSTSRDGSRGGMETELLLQEEEQEMEGTTVEEDMEEQFLCKECGMEFDTKGEQEDHMSMHLGTEEVTCPTCSQVFPSAFLQQRHLVRHQLVEEGRGLRWPDKK